MNLSPQGKYQIQNLDVETICQDFGTPLYVYDAEIIERQVNQLRNAFSGLKLKLKYACKALTNISVLKLMNKLGVEVDTVSIEELEIALLAGYKPNQIVFTPNSLSLSEIEIAIEKGVYINIDNLAILEEFGKKYGNTKPCCVRINPHVEAGGHDKIKTGHVESKFGIAIDYLPQIVEVVNTYNIDMNGLHVHTGSDFSDVEVFLKVADIMFDAAKKFKGIKSIDFGSGFKVAYKKGDKTTDVALLGQKIREKVADFTKEYGSEPEIWFEPGKYLVSDAGILFVTANTLKSTPATTFVGVNSGLNHLIRPMMYGAYHEIVNVSNPNGVEKEFSVVGYICETDTFAWNRPLKEVKAGDTLAMLNAGAYGFSMSSNYNSKPKPAEVMVYKGKAHLIRKRETLADLMQNQISIEL